MTVTPNVVPLALNRDQVKTLLGISDNSKDALIDQYLFDVSDDLFRVNGILNQNFLVIKTGDITDASNEITNINTDGLMIENIVESATGSGIPIGPTAVKIEEVLPDQNTIKISQVASGNFPNETLYIRTLPLGVLQTVAKMVHYKIEQTQPTSAVTGDAKSKSIGPLSITYETGNSGTTTRLGSWGYPSSLIAGLITVRRPRFF